MSDFAPAPELPAGFKWWKIVLAAHITRDPPERATLVADVLPSVRELSAIARGEDVMRQCWRALIRTGSRRHDRTWIVVVDADPLRALGRASFVVSQMKRVAYVQAISIHRLHPESIHGGERSKLRA